MAFDLTFEVQSNGGWDRQRLPATPESAAAAIDKLAGGAIGTLEINNGGEQLWASGGPEWFNVWAQTGPDRFFDLVGDPDAKGTRELIVGGQSSEVPARHCATKERALQAVWGFLSSGHIEVSDERWESQGSHVDSD